MAFHNVRFPDKIAQGSKGGPEFKTTVLELSSGREKRNIDWQYPRARYDVSYGVKARADAEEVIAFFYARQGRAHGFRFKDFADFKIGSTATPQQIGTGNGSTTVFQTVKKYTSGGVTFDRILTRLVTGSVTVYLNGVLQGAGFTVNYDTGTVTFDAAPGGGVVVAVAGQFDVPVRFDADLLQPVVVERDIIEINQLEIVELRE